MPAIDRGHLAAPLRRARAERQQRWAVMIGYRHAGLEIELVPLVATGVVKLPHASFTTRQRNGPHVAAMWIDERNEVRIILDQRDLIVNPGET